MLFRSVSQSRYIVFQLQIADVVNSRHDSVKRTIERLAEKGVISQPPLVDGEKSVKGVVEKLYICVN